jgi:hypothetical protein
VARDAYLRLKQNFDDLGDYDAASWAYCKERRMEKLAALKKAKGAWQKHDWKEAIPRYAKVAGDQLVECVCDYGESFWRVLLWMALSLFGFAAYYWRIGGVWLVKSNGDAKAATTFWHYLIYSAGAFTTTQFTRLQAADDRVRMVTAIQAITGIVLAGLLGFVAGNRIRRS